MTLRAWQPSRLQVHSFSHAFLEYPVKPCWKSCQRQGYEPHCSPLLHRRGSCDLAKAVLAVAVAFCSSLYLPFLKMGIKLLLTPTGSSHRGHLHLGLCIGAQWQTHFGDLRLDNYSEFVLSPWMGWFCLFFFSVHWDENSAEHCHPICSHACKSVFLIRKSLIKNIYGQGED